MLVSRSPDTINTQDDKMWAPLRISAVESHASAVSALLAGGTKQPQDDWVTRRSCSLAAAVERNHMEVRVLLTATGTDAIRGFRPVKDSVPRAAITPGRGRVLLHMQIAAAGGKST